VSEPDSDYTIADHAARDEDVYAGGKYNITLRWLAALASPGARVLNIGCGGGLFNDLLAEHQYEVIGVEPDPDAHAMAAARAGGRYEVRLGGLFDLVDADVSPIVVMHDVLEHIDAEGAAVAKLRSLVEPGGHAVLSVPALELLFGLHDRHLGHYRRYSKRTVKRALSGTFKIDKLRYYGFSGIPAVLWYSKFREQPYPAMGAGAGFVGKLAAGAIRAEEHVKMPVGTSLIALLS
jgi:SAM-dependent methyltransferase